MANMGRSTEHLVRHMGEFSLFVPFVGVFIFIIILLVCMCKGKKGKATSDIESKVLAGVYCGDYLGLFDIETIETI